MKYRDERDALRGRVDGLQEELASTQKELAEHRDDDRKERVKELEEKMAAARSTLDELGRELEAIQGRERPKAGSSRVPLALGVLLILAGVGLGALFLVSRSRSSEVVVRASPPMVEPVPAVPVVPTAAATPKSVQPSPESTTPTPTPVSIRVQWKSKVVSATGRLGVQPGSTCTLDAVLGSTGSAVSVSSLVVTCGTTVVHRSADKFDGMSSKTSRASEEAGPAAGSYRYLLVYQDVGARTGRSQVSVNSLEGAASVWNDSAPAYRIELDLPKYSDLVQGTALLDFTDKALRAKATVASATARAPLKKGASCTVRTTPRTETECVTRIECGKTILYGAGSNGYSPCTIDAGRVATALDDRTTPQGGDPALNLDVAAKKATVRDELDGDTWTVELALQPDGWP